MLSSLKKMRGDRKSWYKVSDLRPGVEIAVPSFRTPNSELRTLEWDEIVSIKPVGREQVYDIEVEGTHNFVGNGIFAHNTYVLRANTMLAVEGAVNANDFVVPIGSQTSNASSGSLTSEIPPEVLTADGLGVDLYKLSTYNLASVRALADKVDAEAVRVTSLESRVDKLESGAVSSATNSPLSLGTTSLASALNSFGVLIKNGIAQFNTLVFRQLVASSDANGTSSAGSVSIVAGNTVAQVSNSLVLPSTKVFITFNAQVTGSWWVSDKTAGSFRVVLSLPQTSDVSFDYFLVQTEGALATSTPVGSEQQAPSSNSDTAPPVINPDETASTSTPVSSEQQAPSSNQTAPASGSTGSPPDGTSSGDTVAPVVTLTGAAALQINVGDTFTDPGATAVDDIDGDLTAKIIETINGPDSLQLPVSSFQSPGLYTLTYTATDTAGNVGSVSRVVTVIAATNTEP